MQYIRRHNKFFLINIGIAMVLFFAFLMLYTLCFYIWRTIGIGLKVYTELRTFTSTEEALSYYFGFSVGSVFFFGIIRHIYNYRRLRAAAQRWLIEKQQAN
jgi:hypothetical protein